MISKKLGQLVDQTNLNTLKVDSNHFAVRSCCLQDKKFHITKNGILSFNFGIDNYSQIVFILKG
jgi:hypothetical protein